MTRWTRVKTVIGGQVCEDDWIVRRDGVDVGRVYLDRPMQDVPPWVWSKTTLPGMSGRADTLEEGLEGVRKAVEG